MSKKYPTGAAALLIAIQTPAPKGQIGIPVLLWGRPGVGKSSFLEGLDQADFPVLTLIASIHDPTDFSGLPIHKKGMVRYAIPEWVKKFEKQEEGLLFLDELTTAPPAVQAALLRVVLERKVGFHTLPDKVRIVAAANPPNLMTGGWDLSPPLRNRFIHLQWDLPTEVYLDALEDGFPKAKLPKINKAAHKALLPKWKGFINGFLRRSPELLHSPSDQDAYGFASPRTWDFAAAILASCDLLGISPLQEAGQETHTCLELLKGCLGEGVTLPFVEFLKNLKLPDPIAVLAGEKQVKIKQLNDSEIYIFFGAMNRILKNQLDDPELYYAALIYFDLVQQVIADGRRDMIYVPLKKISQSGLFLKAMSSAQQAGSRANQAMQQQITALFKDKSLKEFIDVFEK